ncbi:uncharacterized protein LOC135845264 [Planococcus citri]|uniref:uncharacterized protein LOC135845264 n=1 Tax=Planococcus citri TaxID=170843 RepID=UPI0031F76228
MSKIIFLICALQVLVTLRITSAGPSRTASYISDDEADDDDNQYQSSQEDSEFESGSDSDSENENEANEAEEEKEPPHFNCIIIGDQACNATCSTLAFLYNSSSQGTCDKSHICQCTLENKPLAALWNDKFQKNKTSRRLLQKITEDEDLESNVYEILQKYPRTATDSIHELKEEYPDTKEYNKLKPNGQFNMPVSKYIDQDGQLDRKSLRKYLSIRIHKSLKKGDYKIDNLHYKTNIEAFLEDDSILPVIVNDTHFAKFLAKLFPKDKIEEVTNEDLKAFDEISDFVESVIVEQFIKYLKDEKKSKKKQEKKSKKKNHKKSEKSDEKAAFAILFKDFNSINDYKMLNEHWSTKTTDVRLVKKKNGSIDLDWKNEKNGNQVVLSKQSDGTIKQTWQFGTKATIELEVGSNGSIKQSWKIGDKTYKYTKSDKKVNFSGDVNKKDLAIYKHKIRTWCEKNQKLFIANDCIIFNKA